MTWTTNLSPPPNFDSSLEKGTSDVIEVASQSPKEGGNGHGASPTLVRNIARKPPLPYSPVSPTAPPQSRGNSPDVRASSVRPTSVSRATPSPTQDVPVLVRMTFIPQLPDELAITPGETLYIQTEYDDGWALCANISGKEGMVPLECVEGVGGQFAGFRTRA
jgi:Variant SH3 domain